MKAAVSFLHTGPSVSGLPDVPGTPPGSSPDRIRWLAAPPSPLAVVALGPQTDLGQSLTEWNRAPLLRWRSCASTFDKTIRVRDTRLLAKPELSRFYGIRITMNFVDHAPPHFHAMYGKEVFYADARIAIKTAYEAKLRRCRTQFTAICLTREWHSPRFSW